MQNVWGRSLLGVGLGTVLACSQAKGGSVDTSFRDANAAASDAGGADGGAEPSGVGQVPSLPPVGDAGESFGARVLALGSRAEQVSALVNPLVDGQWMMGVSVALIDGASTELFHFGSLGEGRPAVASNTIFEIGSVTKTFTSLLLADLVREGKVGLEDPVASLLPAGVSVPELNGRAITLLDLATHTSGLPRLPTNLLPEVPTAEDVVDPYAEYPVEALYEFLAGYTLPVEPGTRFEYSNLGANLLGHALSLADGTSYAAAIERRISTPLGLPDTVVRIDALQAPRLVTPHDVDLLPVAIWNWTAATEGGGALRGTAVDLARYVVAELEASALVPSLDAGVEAGVDAGVDGSSVRQSMRFTQIPRRPTTGADPIGLAWFFNGDTVLWHNGGTGGSRSMVVFDTARQIGVVVLTNTDSVYTDALASQLLAVLANVPPQSLNLPPHVALGPQELEKFVGTYDLGDGAVLLTITRDGERLSGRFDDGGEAFRLFASGPTTFYTRRFDGTLSFSADSGTGYSQLLLRVDGVDYPALRL